MIFDELHIPLFDFVTSLSKVMDLMAPALVNHHMQAAYLSLMIGAEAGLSLEERNRLVLAAALHDIGAFSFQERLDLLKFEEDAPHEHAKAGGLLLKGFRPFADIVPIIRFHHVPWNHGAGETFNGEMVPFASHVLQLADRVVVQFQRDQSIISQVGPILERIRKKSGTVFIPKLVEALEGLAEREYVWLEVMSPTLEDILRRRVYFDSVQMGIEELTDFTRLLCRVVDFKSRFTATHSSGVAAVAMVLAESVGFSERECQMMKIAAFLHDLGKLAIPSEILNKPGQLVGEERDVMRTHVFYTFNILDSIKGFEAITAWSSLHQERLNGTGYPFHRQSKDLSLGSRIMAVADVFTALTEDRPYRKGMDKNSALAALQKMADSAELDAAIVGMVERQFEKIDGIRADAQALATAEYREFAEQLMA